MHADRGWSEGIGGWEEQGAPVLTIYVRGVWGTRENVMPFQDVIFGRVGDDVWRGVGLDGGIFAGELEVC